MQTWYLWIQKDCYQQIILYSTQEESFFNIHWTRKELLINLIFMQYSTPIWYHRQDPIHQTRLVLLAFQQVLFEEAGLWIILIFSFWHCSSDPAHRGFCTAIKCWQLLRRPLLPRLTLKGKGQLAAKPSVTFPNENFECSHLSQADPQHR